MESTELKDIDFISNPHFTSFPDQTFFTPATTSHRFDKPDSQKKQNEEDDEYITELTRQMTNYMLQDDDKHQKSNGGGGGSGSGSPQSTLWSPFASGYSSPIAPSREPSPPLTPTVEKFIKKIDTNPFQSKQALIDDQIRYIQANFHKIKKEKEKEKKRNDDVLANKARNYHQHHQRPKSRVKAVFVDGSGSRTVSGGTGVFLPRCHGTVVESRKKSGCSTVMVPARVVEALKIHFDKVGVPSTFSSDIPPFHDALLVSMKNKSIKSNSSSRPAQSGSPYVAEISAKSQQEPPLPNLPQEWTY